ncbi:MAG: NAD(P)H-binding protein [Myxococcales bacterium]
MSQSALLVTGASGKLGRSVLEHLLGREAGPLIATTRDPGRLADLAARGVDVRRADFDDEGSMARAFAGAGRALLVSTDELMEPGKRIAQHQRAVKALASAGASHVVYTSFPRPEGSAALVAPDHAATERCLSDSPLGFSVLRNNMYSDLLLFSLPAAIAAGQLVDAKAQGRVAYVTREDCARVAAAALADRRFDGRRVLDVTGPEALSGDDLARLASELGGRPIERRGVSVDQLVNGMVQHGLPEPLAQTYASFDLCVSRGGLADVSDTVLDLTGQKPTSLRDFLAANRAALTPTR